MEGHSGSLRLLIGYCFKIVKVSGIGPIHSHKLQGLNLQAVAHQWHQDTVLASVFLNSQLANAFYKLHYFKNWLKSDHQSCNFACYANHSKETFSSVNC